MEKHMATPWEQAQKFTKSKTNWFKSQTKEAVPTRPLSVLEKITYEWTTAGLEMQNQPSWVFIYSPSSVNQLYEWASNIGEDVATRRIFGIAKLQTVKNHGGIVFFGSWVGGKLLIPGVMVVRRSGLYIFEGRNDRYRLLTQKQYEDYADGKEVP